MAANEIAWLFTLIRILFKPLGRWFKILKRQKARERIRDRSAALRHIAEKGLVRQALFRFYTADALAKEGLFVYSFFSEETLVKCPMVFRKDWLDLSIDLISDQTNYNLVSLDPYRLPRCFWETAESAKKDHSEQKVDIWDQSIYRLVRFEPDSIGMRVDFSVDGFYNFRYSIGLLQDEVWNVLCSSKLDLSNVNLLSDFGLRNQMLPAKNLLRFDRRISAGGVSTIVAFARDDGDFVIPIQVRSSKVSDSPGLLTPIPRAFHQPMVDATEEISIADTVWRELFEELFDGAGVEKQSRHVQPNWWQTQSREISWLKANPDALSFECICFGLDLLQGNYHFGILLVVKDPEFWRTYKNALIHNWEAAKIMRVFTSNTDQIRNFTTRTDWTEDLCIFVESILRLREKFPDRVNIPQIRRGI